MYSYKYPRPALTVDAIVFFQNQRKTYVLLIERGNEPFKNKWALPGGFVNMDELLETACIRELQEETGLKVTQMQQFKAYDKIDRDPRGRTISVVFSARLNNEQKVTGGDDAAHARWFSLDELPPLAFDHQKILDDFFLKKMV